MAASMMARFMPQTQFGVVAGQRVEGWAVGVGWPVDAIVIEAGAFGGVPATGAGVPVDLLPGHGCKRGLLHAVTVRSGHRQQPGYSVGMPPFPKIRRADVTVADYGTAVVDVSGSAAVSPRPVARPRAATIRRRGIRWRPRRACCAPPGSSVG